MKNYLAVGSAVVVLGVAIVGASAPSAQYAAKQAADVPTFNKDVAPILYANCVTCHRPGEIGPMSLLS